MAVTIRTASNAPSSIEKPKKPKQPLLPIQLLPKSQEHKLLSRKHKPSFSPSVLLPNQLLTQSSHHQPSETSYYSQTATAIQDPTTTPSDALIIASFMLDSGASLSVTNALVDLRSEADELDY